MGDARPANARYSQVSQASWHRFGSVQLLTDHSRCRSLLCQLKTCCNADKVSRIQGHRCFYLEFKNSITIYRLLFVHLGSFAAVSVVDFEG